MIYTTLGCLFLIIFGIGIGYEYLWLDQGDDWEETEALFGHPVKFNLSGHAIPITEINEYSDIGVHPAVHVLPTPSNELHNSSKRRAVIFMAFITVAVVAALGSLSIWHIKLISNGETSVEAHINKSETKRLAKLNQKYVNPYNFGSRKNWKLFFGLVKGRTFWRHILLPSKHRPIGNGLRFHTIHDDYLTKNNDWP